MLILAALMASMVGAQRRFRRPLLAGVGVALARARSPGWWRRRCSARSPGGARSSRRSCRCRDRRAAPDPQLVLPPCLLAGEPPGPAPQEEARTRGRARSGSSPRRRSGSSCSGSRASTARASRRCSSSRRSPSRPARGRCSQGVLLGFAGVVGVFALVVSLERRLPHKKMLIATGLLITGVLVVLVGHTVQTMQVVGWMPVTPVEGLSLPFWAGMWFGVYPTWEGLLLQAAALRSSWSGATSRRRRSSGASGAGSSPRRSSRRAGRLSARAPRRDGRAPVRSASPTRAQRPWASRGPRRRPLRGRCRQSRVRASRPSRPARS